MGIAALHPSYETVCAASEDANLGRLTSRECASSFSRHCERSEAIHLSTCGAMDCFASLAMTTTTSFVARMSKATSGTTPKPPRISLRSSGLRAVRFARNGDGYSPASIHSAAPRHNVSRCSGRKNPMCPILLAPVSAGVTVTISGLIEVNPAHSNSTAGRVAQGSSDMQSARKAQYPVRPSPTSRP